MRTLAFPLKCNNKWRGHIKIWRIRTGVPELVLNIQNTKTNAGVAAISDIMITGGTAAPTHIAIGTGAQDPPAEATALGSEQYRDAADKSKVTRTITNDTSRYTKSISITATHNLTEAGLLNAASGGDLFLYQVFDAIAFENGDQCLVQWDLQNS